MTSLTIASSVALLSGAQMPLLGFGVFESAQAERSTTAALRAGYRHIDSARYYQNEEQVLHAVVQFKRQNPGERVWLTTKIKTEEHLHRLEAIQESIDRAKAHGLKWDSFILHDPIAGRKARLEIYQALLEAQQRGEVRSVGVSNFTVAHLEEIREAGLPAPDVNQIEVHPWAQQNDIVTYCHSKGVIIQAYCPLVRGLRMSDPTLLSISRETGQTSAQVLVRWSLQRGFVPLPKSDTPSRITENAGVFGFELSREQMERLDGLDEGEGGLVSWNPQAIRENAEGSWIV